MLNKTPNINNVLTSVVIFISFLCCKLYFIFHTLSGILLSTHCARFFFFLQFKALPLNRVWLLRHSSEAVLKPTRSTDWSINVHPFSEEISLKIKYNKQTSVHCHLLQFISRNPQSWAQCGYGKKQPCRKKPNQWEKFPQCQLLCEADKWVKTTTLTAALVSEGVLNTAAHIARLNAGWERESEELSF